MPKIESVVKRNGAIVPFKPERITNAIYRAAVAVGGRDRTTAEQLSAKVVQLLEKQTPPDHIPQIEEIQDVVEKVLIEEGHARVAKEYILYREERARARREGAQISSEPDQNIPWAKIWHILNWAIDQGVNTIKGLNERIARSELPELIAASEKLYHEDVENAAQLILSRKDKVRMVIITGPSSSGKTTTTIKIGQHLERAGLHLVTLNVDNYFYDLDQHPKDEFGDYDFETPQALDLALINEHLTRLIDGEEVPIPHYDFKTGKRTTGTTPMKLRPGDIILIDSLHGVYPAMTQSVPNEQKFKLYLEPLLQMKDNEGQYIRWTDIRLMRRMLRDSAHRAYDPEKTLLHWHYVRSGEMRNIVPFHNNANYIISSAMPYELSIYRPKLLESFERWTKKYANDPLREDAHERAVRTFGFLSEITPVEDDSVVPKDSVLREFIGGSILKYD
jgi:uridine kinase